MSGPVTKGITLRPSLELLSYYEEVAARANAIRRNNGLRGNVTAQQVMLHRLASLPAFRARSGKCGAKG